MKRLIIVLLLIYFPVSSQITITELKQDKRQVLQFGEIKLGVKIGLTHPSANLEFSDSTVFYLMKDRGTPKINLGIYSTIPLSGKSHFCLEIQRFNNRYNFTTGVSIDMLNSTSNLKPLLSSNYTYSQVSMYPSIKMEVINNLFLGLGISCNYLYKQNLDIEYVTGYQARNDVSLSPRIYANYCINKKISISIDWLFKPIGQERSYREDFTILNESMLSTFNTSYLSGNGFSYNNRYGRLQSYSMRKISFSLIYLIKN